MFQYLEDPSFNLHLHYDKKQKYPPSILNYQNSHADLLYLNFSDCPNKCLLHFFFLFWTNSTLWNSTVDLLLRSLHKMKTKAWKKWNASLMNHLNQVPFSNPFERLKRKSQSCCSIQPVPSRRPARKIQWTFKKMFENK